MESLLETKVPSATWREDVIIRGPLWTVSTCRECVSDVGSRAAQRNLQQERELEAYESYTVRIGSARRCFKSHVIVLSFDGDLTDRSDRELRSTLYE